MDKVHHRCDWCGEPAGILCPDARCLHWLCDACEEVYLFCQDHTDLPLPDPELTPEVNRMLAVGELAWRRGVSCPVCHTGELVVQETLRYSEALHAIARERALECTRCDATASGSVHWSRTGPSAFTAERLRRWKILVGALETDTRVAGDIFEVLLDKELADRFREMLTTVKDRLYAHVIEDDEV